MTEQIDHVGQTIQQRLYLSREECDDLIDGLVQSLKEWDTDGRPFDGFVFIGSGALSIAAVVTKAFPKKAWHVPRIWRERTGEVVFASTLHPDDYQGRSFLLVDEVFDTGATIKAVRERVESLGATVVASVVLHHKLFVPNAVGAPDLAVRVIRQDNTFIVYHWERHEPPESLFRQVVSPPEPAP